MELHTVQDIAYVNMIDCNIEIILLRKLAHNYI